MPFVLGFQWHSQSGMIWIVFAIRLVGIIFFFTILDIIYLMNNGLSTINNSYWYHIFSIDIKVAKLIL
jgi:hypothetical protein